MGLKRALGDRVRALVAGGVEPQLRRLHEDVEHLAQRVAALDAGHGVEQQLRGLREDVERLAQRVAALDATEAQRDSIASASADEVAGLRAAYEHIGAVVADVNTEVHGLRAQLMARLDRVGAIVTAQRDDLPWLRRMLATVRQSQDYEALWSDREPLVSVRIATWNRAETLVDQAIASVLRQTYQRFEIVVVGDGCTDDTESRLQRVGDDRIRFHNLPVRSGYPDDPDQRWMVAGTPPANLAVSMASGSWIASLDDDDEFTDDHLEVLLEPALDGRFELFYGRFEGSWPGVEDTVLGGVSTAAGQITMQATIYPRLLAFFEFDPESWMIDEPADWNLIRRMVMSGVRVGFTERVVTRINPSGPDSRS